MPNIISNKSLSNDYKNHYMNLIDDYRLYELDFIEPVRNLKFYTYIENDYLFVKLVNIEYLNDIKLVAFAALELVAFDNSQGYQIKLTKSFVANQGYMSYIFKFILLELDESIYSDTTHTLPGSMNFWKRLNRIDNSKLEIIDTVTGIVQDYSNQEDHLIWGVDPLEFGTEKGVVNIDILDQLHSYRMINNLVYDYCINNNNNLIDRKHIILRLSKKQFN